MRLKYPAFFLSASKCVSKFNYKRRILAFRIRCVRRFLNHKSWIHEMIKRKVLLYVSIISLTCQLFLERGWRRDAEMEMHIESKKALMFESQAKSLRKTYSDIPASLFEKLKRGDRFIMLNTNDYYGQQFTSKLGYDKYDYLGEQDAEIQDPKAAEDYNREDLEVTVTGERKWFKGVFIDKRKDTLRIATFKARRIEINNDTILIGLVFDLEKMKKELNLKE